jgi:hypothetical protein
MISAPWRTGTGSSMEGKIKVTVGKQTERQMVNRSKQKGFFDGQGQDHRLGRKKKKGPKPLELIFFNMFVQKDTSIFSELAQDNFYFVIFVFTEIFLEYDVFSNDLKITK